VPALHAATIRLGIDETPAFTGVSEVEPGGLEPPTSWVRSRRSPS
jgi:hypothetical protein